jgi:lipopolysaccharide/colanic/teichoic acid biosynthesis glycosyltransferase
VVLGTVLRLAKRAIDVAGATTVLIVSAPALVASAAAVRLKMGSPVLFRQPRPGLNGRPFMLYKLRTMAVSADQHSGPGTDAQRLTSLGRWLRSSSLDELPQLFNVLKGDMSLVGPRPLMMQYLPRYSTEQARRHDVRPGITGWAQVHGRNTVSWDEKFKLDVWYVDHWSLWLDLKILAMTAGQVVRRSGVSSGNHPTMPEFMGPG